MKGYLKRIAGFLLFFFVVISLLQLAVSLNIRHRSLNGHDNLEQTENINADLIFLGSSRCRAHFDPVFFDTAYHLKSVNLGMDGHSEIAMAVLRLRLYLAGNKAPKFILFNFDPLVTTGSESANKNFVHKNDFARYAFLPGRSYRPLVDYFQFNALERYLPMYAIFKYQLFSKCWSRSGFPYSVDSYDKHPSSETLQYSTGVNNLKLEYPGAAAVEEIKTALSSFNEICRRNKIRLICIQTPVYNAIYDAGAFSYPGEVCKELNIPFIDADIPEIRNDQKNFYNADHMNIVGVEKMNKYLATDTVLAAALNRPVDF